MPDVNPQGSALRKLREHPALTGMTTMAVALTRLNPSLDDVEAWLNRPNGPHTYLRGFHDNDCVACKMRDVLRTRKGGPTT